MNRHTFLFGLFFVTIIAAAPAGDFDDAFEVLSEMDSRGEVLFASEELAFVKPWGGRNLEIFDISNTAAPVLRTTYAFDGIAGSVAVEGSTCYVGAWLSHDTSGVHVLDLSDPTTVALKGAYMEPGLAFSAYPVVVENGILFMGHEDGVRIMDFSDPTRPVGLCNYPGTGVIHVEVRNSLLYFAGRDSSKTVPLLGVLDISDPTSPVSLALLPTDAPADDFAIAGDALYMPLGKEFGVGVFDISEPATPQRIGTLPAPSSMLQADGDRLYVTAVMGPVWSPNSQVRIHDIRTPLQPRAVALVADLYEPILFFGGLGYQKISRTTNLRILRPRTPLDVPDGPAALDTEFRLTGEVPLSWQDRSTGELGFRIEQYVPFAEGGLGWTPVALTGPNANRFTYSVPPGVTGKRFRVRAYNDAGASFPTNEIVAPLRPPANLEATSNFVRVVSLTWEDRTEGEDGFLVQQKIGEDGEWEFLTGVAPDTTQVGTWVTTPGLTLYYRVRAYNAHIETAWSNVARVVSSAEFVGLEVLEPNGGEQFTIGTFQEIRWKAPERVIDPVSIDLQRVTDFPDYRPIRIASDLPVRSASFLWYVDPAVFPSGPYLVKVTTRYLYGDYSDGPILLGGGNHLFLDHFEDNQLRAWAPEGAWEESGGRLRALSEGRITYGVGADWRDYAFDFVTEMPDPPPDKREFTVLDIFVRYKSPDTFYRVRIETNDDQTRIRAQNVMNGEILSSRGASVSSFTIVGHHRVLVREEAGGTRIVYSHQGTTRIDYLNEWPQRPLQGGIGFAVDQDLAGQSFDDVVVTALTSSLPIDLTVHSADAGPGSPAVLAPGDPVAVGAAIENLGIQPAGPFWVELWGSRRGGLTLDEMLVPSLRVPGLAEGALHSWTASLPLLSVAEGPYTPVFVVNRPGGVDEADRRNNRAFVAGRQLTVLRPDYGVDLAVEDFDLAPNPAFAGDPLQIAGRVVNRGQSPSGPFWIEFWGSRAWPEPTLEFFLTDSIRIEDLAPGGAVSLGDFGRALYNVPGCIAQVGCVIDRAAAVADFDRTNNFHFRDGQIFNRAAAGVEAAEADVPLPDLTVVAASLTEPPKPIRPRDRIDFSIEVENSGVADSGPVWTEVWLSRDGGLTLNHLFHSQVHLNIAAGARHTTDTSVAVRDVPDGAYWAVVVIDRMGEVPESGEADNRRAIPGRPLVFLRPPGGANLIWEDFSFEPSPARPGLALGGRVRNVGTEAAGSFWIEFFLDGGDPDYPYPAQYACTSIAVSGLAPGESFDVADVERELSFLVKAGQYTAIGYADGTDQVGESDETDNYVFVRGVKIP